MRLFTFLVLEVLLSPITLTGYALFMTWALAVSRQKGISMTALVPLSARWLLHLQGIRPDPLADSLMNTLPCLNSGINWAIAGPTLLAMNISGYTPSLFNLPPPGAENLGNLINTRTLFFDRALSGYLETVEQVVVLGAGFDTRLFKFCLGRNLALFEVDQPNTQAVKKRALIESDRTLDEICFVTANFNEENWIDNLLAAGFEVGKKTFFLWEGVTYYLTEAVVKETLGAIGEICGVGSAIAFDFFPQHFYEGRDFWWIPFAINALDWIGEPFRFGADTDRGNQVAIDQLLAGTGFQLSKLQMAGEVAGEVAGDMAGDITPSGFYGLVVAAKEP
ncbi:MAG: SAM-dependent methyltransferase [Phormidesmis sp.]